MTQIGSEYGRCCDTREVESVAAEFGLRLLEAPEMPAAHALTIASLGDCVASVSSLESVQTAAGAALFGFFENSELTGVLAAFPLNQDGLSNIKARRFNAAEPLCGHVAKRGDAPAAYYGWCFVGQTKEAARAVIKASVDIHRRLYWDTPTFARAVTSDGVRALTSIGFRPADWADHSLLWIEPRSHGRSR
jgi:hypothetical protein